jgi:hypothetical protein
MQAAFLALVAAQAIATPIVGLPPIVNDYGVVVSSPQPIGDAWLYGSGLVLRPSMMTNLGMPGVLMGGNMSIHWEQPVKNAAVTLSEWYTNGNGATTIYGWRDGQLVGSIEQPAIAPWQLGHSFEADPSWIIDTLTWEGQGGQVWAVRYEMVPEPSTMILAMVSLAIAGIGVACHPKRESR